MIKKFNILLFKIIIVVALLPLLIALILALSPLGLALLALGALIAFRSLRSGASRFLGGTAKAGSAALTGGITSTGKGLGWLFGFSSKKRSGRFMGTWEKARALSSSHQGFLLDGKSKRLSEKAGYESLLIQGGMGKGKTSTFVMPNLLMPPSSKPSFVITDTSGEIYQNTSGYLKSQGYQIQALNLMDLNRSESYNPMARITEPQHVADLAGVLINASTSQHSHTPADPFWNQAAEKLIRIMVQCLMNQGDAQYQNLANLRHLITGFDAHLTTGNNLARIDQFVLKATRTDPTTFSSYKAFIGGNIKTIQSILMSADVALDAIAIPEIATITAKNSLDFSALRQAPTALYVIVNQTKLDLYGFLLNLFYADLFRALLVNAHDPGRPVWLMLDEFGHLSVKRFEVFATTARKYKISYTLFLQSMAQLEGQYGAKAAHTIREGLGTEIYLPGTGLKTAREIEARLGRKAKSPLMSADEIIRLKEREALMLHSNRLPIKLKTKPYYKHTKLKRRAKMRPSDLPTNPIIPPSLITL